MNEPNSSSQSSKQPRVRYQYLVVYYDPVIKRPAQSLDELNGLLSDGWNPVRETPMGGAGGKPNVGFVSLVLLEKDE